VACLGRQVQARISNESQRRLHLRTVADGAGDRTVTLAMLFKNTVPNLETKCERRERRGRYEERDGAIHRVILRIVVVKDILIL
jgi:hypothetical protein